MKLTTVLSCVNDNPAYYLFIPKQIAFWRHLGIQFVAVFVGERLPPALLPYADHIQLWTDNLDLNTVFVAQNLRIYYPSLLELPDDELVMITDMDMLPTKATYYCSDLDQYNKEDFLYYRSIDQGAQQIYMCYNAAHPTTWQAVFGTHTRQDVAKVIHATYVQSYSGVPGSTEWFIDQEVMYRRLVPYPHLKVLHRPLRRLEVSQYQYLLFSLQKDRFIEDFDDVHFHRSYQANEYLIANCEMQLGTVSRKKVIAFGLWGNNPTYNVGTIRNVIDAKVFYPDFECWVYVHVDSVPQETIDALKAQENCRLVFKQGDIINEACKPRMWRFEPIDVGYVDVLLSRDTDTRFTQRERMAVYDWLRSGASFHIMRDHPHHDFLVLAGMFGTRKLKQLPFWRPFMQAYVPRDNRMYDQQFLEQYVYPLVQTEAMVHASFHRKEPQAIDFPIAFCKDHRFVGEYVYHDESRSSEHVSHLKMLLPGHYSSPSSPSNIHLISTFYVSSRGTRLDNARTSELVQCLQTNLANPCIASVHLFVENEQSLEMLHAVTTAYADKVVVINVGKKPLYTDFLRYIVDHLNDHLCMIANADIYLGQCDYSLIERLRARPATVYCLTRYEHDFSHPLMDNYSGSHDCYLFHSSFVQESMVQSSHLQHFQNYPGIESHVIKAFCDHGFVARNPCFQIKIIHLHRTQLRCHGEWIGLHAYGDMIFHQASCWWVPPTRIEASEASII